MIIKKTYAGITLLWAFMLVTGLPVMAEVDDALEAPQLKQPLSIFVPQNLRHLSDKWNEGKVFIRIGADGKVNDWIPMKLPHYRLFNAVGRALNAASFEPARIDGSPVAVDLTVSIPLGDVGFYNIIAQSVAEDLQSNIPLKNRANELVLSGLKDLDQPLRLLESGMGTVPVDDDGNVLEGIVTVEFFVDPEGRPRMVRAVDEENPALAEAARLNVETFQFNKPRCKGRPTVVRARMPIVIRDKS